MRWIVVPAAALLLAACAHGPPAKAPGCKGPRRPANLYGSVLQVTPPESATPPAASSPPQAVKPDKLSANDPTASTCGGLCG